MKKRYQIPVLLAVVIILLLSVFMGNGVSSVAGYYSFTSLLAPDFAEVVPCDVPIIFRWSPSGTEGYVYRFMLYEDLDFHNQVAMALTEDTKFEYKGPVKCKQIYYWNVRVIEPIKGELSATWCFSTEDAPPAYSNQDKPPFMFPAWLYFIIAAVLFIVLTLGIWKITRH